MAHGSVTILITVKNSAKTIEGCIKSVLATSYRNKKIVVVDAFSTDGTWQILQKYSHKIKLFRLVGNAPTAFNFALKKIASDFVAFTDGDCVVAKDWLCRLLDGFNEGIVATAGYCSTAKSSNRLQQLIGRELESRFQKFPHELPRAPTMNLCVRTPFAKRIRFDERLDTAFETDFGYRLSKLGKIKYVPKAVVWHNHRASWRSYFRQQFGYGKSLPLLYAKHPRRLGGDPISTPLLVYQELFFAMFFIAMLVGLLYPIAMIASLAILFALLTLYIAGLAKLIKSPADVPLFITLFLVRNVAWSIGILSGLVARRKK